MIALLFATCMLLNAETFPQEGSRARSTPVVQDTPVESVLGNPFRQALVKSAVAAAKSGKIKRIELIRLRVATMSPAFLEHAQELAIIQMAFSGDEVPLGEDGSVDEAAIDWDKLASFLEKIIPLILQLIDKFALTWEGGVFYV